MDLVALVFGIAGVVLSFLSSVVIALPFIESSEIEEMKKHVQIDSMKPAFCGQPSSNEWPNHPVWKAFMTQRKYTLLGLVVLAVGIALEITSVYLQAA